ncbi:AAA family ATPase [Streptomyces prunicolor]|uniref:AAA family ATPase n=1 Tax=Streptomyces prunicolor TaxID=67348 RepID=UPI000475B608|nr:AAA family ATPase [Streptomyces prunicolor]
MRKSTRTEVRQTAEAMATETVMRCADALARSPYAERTMETTSRRVAAEVARTIADERVAHADEIVRAAAAAAKDTATETARQVAEETSASLAAEAAARTLKESREAVAEALGESREAVRETLGTERRKVEEELARTRAELDDTQGQLTEALGRTRRELAEAREEVVLSAGRFARDEAVRVVAEAVAEQVPPVVEVRVAEADPVRVGGHSHVVLPDVLLALGAGCHVLLVGPAGTGKSMMARQTAEAFGQEFHALSLGPTTPMSKIFGYYDAHGQYHGTPFRSAFEHGGLMLLDELDSGHPGLLAELNQALSIRSCAFADGMVAAHPEFRLIATANTYGTGGDRQYVGRQALDAATLDRFVVIDVPVDEDLEERIALAHAPSRPEDTLRVIEEVRRLRATAAEKRLPVMFSPRAGIDAAKLLQAGASVEQAIRWRVVRGMSAAHRSALGLAADGGEGAE